MKRTSRDYGYSYAVSINATELYQHQTGDGIPEEAYLDMRRNGVVANISEYWAGYNEYIYETQELKKLKKEIKGLKQAIFNCK